MQKDGTPDTSGAPYVTTIMVGDDFTANSSTNLAAPADGLHTQSIGLEVNGTVTTPGHNFNPSNSPWWGSSATTSTRPTRPP